MNRLTAKHAVSSSVRMVSAEMRVRDIKPDFSVNAFEAYAVFSDIGDPLTQDQFLGIVPKYMVDRYPYRIFADLIPLSKSILVEPSAPLDMLYGEFQRNTVDAFSVMESGRRFLGAVTPTSLLETMLQREQFLTSCLHKEIGTKQSAEGQLRQAREALSTHAEQRVESVRDHKQQLGDLSERLLSTDKRERHLLAGELHDHLAQLLAVGRIKLAQGTQITRDPAILKIFHTLEQIFQESLNYTRTLITELSSTHLHRIGLLAALEGLTEKMQRLGLKVTLEAPQPMPDLSENHAFVLYWSLRELLFNVIKHARTNHTTVSIRQLRHSHLQCIVSDEGRGFDLQKQTLSDISPGHCGLSGIHQRMTALQGTMTMHSSPGRGTQVVLTLPLSETSPPD